MILLNLLLIQFIVAAIIDDSGVIDSIKRLISRILTKGKIETTNFDIKPFSCSYCMNFWIGLIYLFCVGKFTIPYIAFVLLLSTFVFLIKEIIILAKDGWIWVREYIYHKMDKNKKRYMKDDEQDTAR